MLVTDIIIVKQYFHKSWANVQMRLFFAEIIFCTVSVFGLYIYYLPPIYLYALYQTEVGLNALATLLDNTQAIFKCN